MFMQTTTGELKPMHGSTYYSCVDCKTTYPAADGLIAEISKLAMCNSHPIKVCPWCRPDSKPWMNGRGI